MEFRITFDTVKSGCSIIKMEGSQLIISKFIVFQFLKIFFFLSEQTVQDQMKCRVSRHFIWVFNVCKSIRLGLSSIQKVDLFMFWLISGESGIHLERHLRVGTDSQY